MATSRGGGPAVVSDRRRRRSADRCEPTYLCTRCGGARVECARDDEGAPAYTCPNCDRPHTIDGEQYVPPEVRQYTRPG